MASVFLDEQWDDLLGFIEDGRVLPIVGEGAVTFGTDDQPLFPWLAKELAGKLAVDPAKLPSNPAVSDVAQRHLMSGGERNAIYSRLQRILKNASLTPGPALRHLAEIEAFQLYLTTTFDPLLERALNEMRFSGQPFAQSLSFFPGASEKDLPAPAAKLSVPTVYHLLGRVSVAVGEFVAWEEDLLDFLFELPRHLGTDTMRNLSADMRSNAILAVGLGFSDWISRLLLRIAKQDSLSRVALHSWLAEGPPDSVARSMVLFFGGVSCAIHVIECHPPAFAAELARRWRERHPTPAQHTPTIPPVQRGLVFISYAREDEAAARRVKDALVAAGCEVYFDRERLSVGTNFHYQLEDQVLLHCTVFVSLISPFTESAVGEHYFLRERHWASERAEGFSDDERWEFYLPFLLHDNDKLPDKLHQEPRIFSGAEWNKTPGGKVPPELARRVADLQKKFRAARL